MEVNGVGLLETMNVVDETGRFIDVRFSKRTKPSKAPLQRDSHGLSYAENMTAQRELAIKNHESPRSALEEKYRVVLY